MPPLLAPRAPSSGPRLAGVEGLRGLGAAGILVFHVWLYSSPDASGVDVGVLGRAITLAPTLVLLFFVLSAFLLYRPFAAAILRGHGRPSLAGYAHSRIFRILPAYWAILLACSFVLQTTNVREPGGVTTRGPLDDPVQLLANLLLLQGFFPGTVLTGIGPAWALVAIVSFYAVLPALLPLAWMLARGRGARGRLGAALAPAAVLVAVGVAGKLVAAFVVPPGPAGGWGADWHTVVVRGLFGNADAFGFGLAAAVVLVVLVDRGPAVTTGARVTALAALAAVTAAVSALTVTTGDRTQISSSLYVYEGVMGLVLAGVVVLVVLPGDDPSRPWLLARTLERRAFVAIGVVSYSLYLWHEPLFHWLRDHDLAGEGAAAFAWSLPLTAVLSFALALLTYLVLERPRWTRQPRRPGPGREAAGRRAPP